MRQKPENQTIRDTNKKLWIQQIMDTKKIMDNNKNMETKQRKPNSYRYEFQKFIIDTWKFMNIQNT